MARKRVVSRTIPKLTAEVAVGNIKEGKVITETVELPANVRTDKGILKFAKNLIEVDANKSVMKVLNVNKTDVKYEMPEELFIKTATVVEPAKTETE